MRKFDMPYLFIFMPSKSKLRSKKMKKTIHLLTTLLSAGLISASLIGSISSSAYITPGSDDCWNAGNSYGTSRCLKKNTDSSIWVFNNSYYNSYGAYISIYGNNDGRAYTQFSVNKCSQYWETLTTTDLYFEPRTSYFVRNYVKENQYKYAVIKITPEGTGAYGSWKADLYGNEASGCPNIN